MQKYEIYDGVKLSSVSNCPRCQIVLPAWSVSNCPILHDGVKLSSVSNCPRCQIVLLAWSVSNCPRCQIVHGVKLSHHRGELRRGNQGEKTVIRSQSVIIILAGMDTVGSYQVIS